MQHLSKQISAPVYDETLLAAEVAGVAGVPVVELEVDGVRLLSAEGASVSPEAAVNFLDVPDDGFALRLDDVAPRTLELPFALLRFVICRG